VELAGAGYSADEFGSLIGMRGMQNSQCRRGDRKRSEEVRGGSGGTAQCTVSGTRGTPAACAPGAPRDPIR
jgi:hypothetical protein